MSTPNSPYADLLSLAQQVDQSTKAGAPAAVARAPAGGGSVDAFVAEVAPVAHKVGARLGVDPAILIGQWGLETGWGKSVIPGTNNFGNIKDFSGNGVAATDNMTGSRDRYRQYASYDAFADDFAGLLERRYSDAIGAGADALRFGSALKAGGYAEDPDYAAKLARAAEMVRGASGGGRAASPQRDANRYGLPNNPYSFADFDKREADQAVVDTANAERTWGEALQDTGLAVLGGAGGMWELAGVGYGLVTGDFDNLPRHIGEAARGWAQENQSATLQAQKALRAMTIEGQESETGKFFAFLSETLGSPELAVDFLAEQTPQLIAMGGIGRGAAAGMQALGAGVNTAAKVGTVATVGAGSTMQGLDAAGQAYDQIMALPREMQLRHPTVQKLIAQGLTESEAVARAARASAITAGALSGGASALLNALPGASTLERTLAGGAGRSGSRAMGAIKSGVAEGSTEAADEAGGVLAGNYATQQFDSSQDLTQGIGEAAASGFMFAPFGAVAGAAEAKKPNSPLTNAANAATAAGGVPPAAPAGVPPGVDPAAAADNGEGATQESTDPFAERLAKVASFVEDKTFQRTMRDAEGYGKESLNEALRAFVVARNPNTDPLMRERALGELEQFVETFNRRPNFTMGGQQTEAGAQVVPAGQAPQSGPVPQLEAPDFAERDITPRPVEPAGLLETEEALQAARNATAAYEQAYQDLVKAEQLGASDAELLARQQAVESARLEQEAMTARLAEIQQTIEGNRAQDTAAKRRAVLDAVLADPQTANPRERFAAELKRQGFRDSTPSADELATIARFEDVKNAAAAPEIEPSTPNEFDPYARQGQPAQPAQKAEKAPQQPKVTLATVKQAVADGYALDGNRLVKDGAEPIQLTGPNIAAAKEAIRRRDAQNQPAPAAGGEAAPVVAEQVPAPAAEGNAGAMGRESQAEAPAAVQVAPEVTADEKPAPASAAQPAHLYPEATARRHATMLARQGFPSDVVQREGGWEVVPATEATAAPKSAQPAATAPASQPKPEAAPEPASDGDSVSQSADTAPAVDPLDEELQDALSHLGDVLGDVFGAQLKITGTEYGAKDLLPALSKVVELLVRKGFRSFTEAVGNTAKIMRSNAATAQYVDQISPRQWKAAYNAIAEFHDGTDSEEAVSAFSADDVKGLIAGQKPAAPKAEIKSELDAAAHEAATSPLNDTPHPTDEQKAAGNYKVGRLRLHGLDISIENPRGSVRSGTAPDGSRWQNTLAHHYGYIRGSEGKDGDHLDVFLTDDAENATAAWVVDQKNKDGAFDEHKIVIGPQSEAEARAAYLANYDAGWAGLGAITSMPMEAFKAWALDGKKKRKPLAYVAPEAEQSAPAEAAESQAAATAEESSSVPEPKNWRKSYGQAQQYARALGVDERGEDGKYLKLPQLVAAIEAKRAEAAEPVAGANTSPERVAETAESEQVVPSADGKRRGEVGMKLAPGDVVLTNTGRETTPFPPQKSKPDTDRKLAAYLKKVDEWLIDNARAEARARNDEFNLLQFNAMDLGNLSQADKDSAEHYLFDADFVFEQPAPLLKPLAPAGEITPELFAQELRQIGHIEFHGTSFVIQSSPRGYLVNATFPTYNKVIGADRNYTAAEAAQAAAAEAFDWWRAEQTKVKASASETLLGLNKDGDEVWSRNEDMQRQIRRDGKAIIQSTWTDRPPMGWQDLPKESAFFRDNVTTERGETRAKRAEMRVAAEREAFDLAQSASLLHAIATNENNDDDHFRLGAESHLNKLIGERMLRATKEQDVGTLRAFDMLFVNGRLTFGEDFYTGLRAALQQRALEAKQDKLRAEGRGDLAKALQEAAYDPESENGTRFIQGWEHALDGKTKSTLPSGDAFAEGYESAQQWMKTPEGKAAASGRRTKKLQNTGADLRRWFDDAKAKARAEQTDVDKLVEQLEAATSRAELMRNIAAPDATPGTIRLLNALRNHVPTFKEWLLETSALSRTNGIWHKEAVERLRAFIKGDTDSRFDNALNANTEAERMERAKDLADQYIDHVREIAEAMSGVATVEEAAKRLSNWLSKRPEKLEGRYGDLASSISEAGEALRKFGVNLYRINDLLWHFGQKQAWIRGEWVAVEGGYAGSTAAEFMAKQNDPLESTRKQALTPPRLDRVERDGKDWRDSKDITPEQFKKTFGFADVGFGQWVGARQDQDHLNYSFDAFRDLAALLNLPAEAIALNGRLHFTIGALGQGKFAAHYSPNQPHPDGGTVPVINVTNTKGDGTVAHEWAHALDLTPQRDGDVNTPLMRAIETIKRDLRYGYDMRKIRDGVSRMLEGMAWWRGDKSSTRTDAGRIDNARRAIDYYARQAEQPSEFIKEAIKLDGKEGKYWSNDKEPFARAFEAWALDALEGKSTYLVNPMWVGEGLVTGATHRGTPYPVGEERKRFNEWFAALAKSLKVEDGRVELDVAAWEEHRPKHQDEWRAALENMKRELPDMLDAIKLDNQARDALLRQKVEEGRKIAVGDLVRYRSVKDDTLYEVTDVIAEPDGNQIRIKDARGGDSSGYSYAAHLFDVVPREAAAETTPAEAPKPAPEPTPPAVPEKSPEPAGELSEADYERLFDEAAAELAESTAEQPAAEQPGAKILLPAQWTVEDVRALVSAIEGGSPVLVASSDLGIPTIHDFSSKARHLGFGMFEISTPEYEANMDGGGAMERLPSGQGFTRVRVTRGTFPFDREAVLAKLRGLLVEGKATAEQEKTPSNLRASAPKGQPEQKQALPTLSAEQEKTAAAMAAEAAKLGVKGVGNALSGLVRIFGGGPNKLSSFPGGFDEDAYKQAKPYFEEALRNFQEAGRTLKDLFKFLIEQFGNGIKPYAIRFAKDQALTTSLGEKPSAAMQVADFVKGKLDAGAAFSSRELFDVADTAFGGSQADGTYSPKDAYDGMEAGVNKWLMSRPALDGSGSAAAAADVVRQFKGAILEKLPTQTRRDAEMDEFQQFSTPPSLAYVASWVANVSAADTMMEPSAGTGDLAVYAHNAGARIVLNELSSRRAAVLKSLFPQARIFTENAEQLNNILPMDVRPTVVVMNPPFSATAGRVQGQRKSSNGAVHIEQALKRLAKGGRLVAIMGEGMGYDKPAFRSWYSNIQKDYNVRAVIGIDGREYAKYGTTFDNVILVIDKDGPQRGKVLTSKVDRVEDLPALLEEIRNERPQIADENRGSEPPADQRDGKDDSAQDDLGGEPDGSSRPGADALGGGKRGSGRKGSGGNGGGGRSSRGSGGSRADAAGDGDRSGDGSDGSGGKSAAGTDGQPRSDVTVEEQEQRKAEGELTDSVFEHYAPQRLKIAGAKPHPGKLVQSAAMAAVEPPAPTYTPNLPKEVIDKGLLSIAQLEAVVYAGQAHEQTLPSDERRGFFIGDGTGVGKGREIAGIILDNMRQGRKKAVWISFNQGLMADAKRDFAGVGGDDSIIFWHGKTKPADPIQGKSGILFTTYSTLRGGEKKQATATQAAGKSRVDQLVEWLGEDFDGAIMFDEAHSMGNAVAVKGKRGNKKPSAQALAGIELQKRLPKARVVYVSATGATEVNNLAYASRLGLWGEGTPFANVQDFISRIVAGGVAGMELVARDMKALGMYIARSLSFDGVTYRRHEHDLTDLQRDIYNELATAWQLVLKNVNAALEMTEQGSNGNAKSAAMSRFWGTHQRFFNQIITAMMTPSVIDDIRQQVADGNAVVIQLINTNEAEQERQAAKAADEEIALEELDFTPRQALMDYVRNGFPVAQYEEVTDENGNLTSQLVKDSEGNPVLNADAVAMRDELLATLEQIKVPGNPLDEILEAFGSDKVAEVTGRKRRFVRVIDEDGNAKLVEEKRGAGSSASDAADFQGDKKRILVFSQAGGTGYSFHADNTAKNKRKRVHYILQPGWRADAAVQGFGRSHRTNQATTPEYVLCTTDLKAQKRFVSSIARRLDQLGALTRGQRQATSQGMFSASDNLESKYAEDALSILFSDLSAGTVADLSFAELREMMGFDNLVDQNGTLNTSAIPGVPQFLNRLLSLTDDMQNRVFDAFEQRLIEVVEFAKQQGTYDTGLSTLRAESVKIGRNEKVHEDERTGAETHYAELAVSNPVRFNTFDAVSERMEQQYGSKFRGWYVNKDNGTVFAFANLGERVNSRGEVHSRAAVLGIKGGIVYSDKAQTIEQGYTYVRDPNNRYGAPVIKELFEKVDADRARELFEQQVALAPAKETQDVHVISGVILPIWDRMPVDALIVRTQTDDGARLLGRVIPKRLLKGVLRNLGVGSAVTKMKPAEILAKVLEGQTAILGNGWQIKRSLVSGDQRIEIVARSMSPADSKLLVEQGAFSERIQWVDRFFIPAGKNAEAVFERITAAKPVVELIDPKASNTDDVDDAPSVLRTTVDPDAAAVERIALDRADADRFVRDFVARFPAAPEIVVVSRFDQLPADVQKDAGEQEAGERTVKGAFNHRDGRVYVVAGNHRTIADFEATVLHETIGHAGVRRMFGQAWVQKLNQLYIGLGGDNGVIGVMLRRGLGDQLSDYYRGIDAARKANPARWTDDLARAVLTEEVFAHIAEQQGRRGLRDRFLELVGAVRQWLRDKGFAELAKLGEADLLFTLSRARTEMRRGDTGVVREGVVTAREAVGENGRPIPQGDPDFANAMRLAKLLGIEEQQGATVFRKSEEEAGVPRGTRQEAEARGYVRAYRGASRAAPFNDTETVWLTSNREVAAAYAEEVFAYDDPAVMEVWYEPKAVPTYDMRRISEDELEALGPDEFGNPQAPGIYRNADDSPLGGGYPHTVIHVPKAAAMVVDDGGADLDGTGFGGIMAARRAPKIDTTNRRTALFTALAKFDEAFQLPTPEGKTLEAIAQEIDPGYRAKAMSEMFAREKTKGRATKAWEISVPRSNIRVGYVFEDVRGRVWIDVSQLRPGIDTGNVIYGIVSGYAHNAGKQFIGDPEGLSPMAFFRRLENMISSALRYGTTNHLYPHAAQVDPAGYYSSAMDYPDFAEETKGLGLDWKEGDFSHNLSEMMRVSYNAAIRFAPELRDVIYDFDTRQFVDAATGERRSRDTFKNVSERLRARPGARYLGGSSTLARAALVNTLLRREGKEAWRGIMVALGDQLRGRGLDFELNDIFYKKDAKKPGNTGLTAEQFRAALTDRFGEEGVRALEAQGLLNIIDPNDPEVGGALDPNNPAWYNPNTGEAFFAPSVMTGAEDAVALVLHEVGEHHGLQSMLGDRAWRTLKGRIAALAREGKNDIRAAWDGVIDTYPEFKHLAGVEPGQLIDNDRFMHEVIAKIGETAAGRKSGLWRDLLAAVNRFLLKLGIGRQINKNELADLVAGSLKRVMGGKGGGPRGGVPMASRTFALNDYAQSREGRSAIRERLGAVFDAAFSGDSVKTFNWWNRTLGSQFHKAKKSREFAKVYDIANAFIDDVSRFANRAADRARGILPHLDTLKDIGRGLNVRQAWADAKDYAAIAPAVFEGTLVNGNTGKVWTDRELRDRFDLNPLQIRYYREFRDAVDYALEMLATSEMARAARVAKMELADPDMRLDETEAFYVGQIDAQIESAQELLDEMRLRHELEREQQREALRGFPRQEAIDEAMTILERRHAGERQELESVVAGLQSLRKNFTDKAARTRQLQAEGYAPLMRFGRYTVDVVALDEDGNPLLNDDGEPDRPFFGMFETEAEARDAARLLAEEYPDYVVRRGIMSEKANELYRGITPETAEMFARLLGTDTEGAFQAYLKQAVANRSAMKRLIQRKGMDGFAQDVPRVLSAFITSNARLAAGNWHFGDMMKAAEAVPRDQGDVKDEAIKLVDYIQNPREEAAEIRGLLFFNFLGGSIAAAAVNLTQTFTTTLPYLSQFGARKAGKAIGDAMALAAKLIKDGDYDAIQDVRLREAVKRAADEGVIDPQEIHLLMAESGGAGASGLVGSVAGMVNKEWAAPASRVARALTQGWGSLFGAAEKYNRHVAFIAAWEAAPAGVDRYAFAKNAVTETQFQYTKVNRPNWARGAVGATLFTFKTFMVNYLEFLARLPTRERALAVGVLLLLSGLSGAPGADDLDDLIDAIGQKLGYNWNNAAARHAFLVDVFGQGGANFVEHGVSSFLPIDVSARLGMGNLIPGTEAFKKSSTDKSRDVAEFFGPAGSLSAGAFKVLDSIGSGKDIDELVRPIAPKAYNDAWQAIDILQAGYYRDSRGRKVVEADGFDAFMKAIGFQPNQVAEPRRVEWMIAQSAAMHRAVRADVNELWARGVFENDPDKVAAARAMVADWNRKNPTTPIRVKPESVAQRVRSMRASSAERMVKATSRDMRGMIREELKVPD